MASLSVAASTNSEQVSTLLTTCYICKETYKSPKVLSCYHTFCEVCIQGSIPGHGLSLHCVICGHQSIVPKEGVAELKRNPYVERIMQAAVASSDSSSNDTEGDRTDVSELHANLAMEYPDKNEDSAATFARIHEAMPCNSHCGNSVSMYCRSCDMVVCKDCAKLEHVEHHDAVTTLENLSLECEDTLLKQADTLEQKMSPLQKALGEITEDMSKLEMNKDEAEELINDTFDVLERALCRRRGDLLRKAEGMFIEKYSKLEDQLKEIKRYIASMEEGLDLIVQSLSTTEPKPICERTKETSSRFDKEATVLPKPTSNTEAFFLHKQISRTIDDLCRYKLRDDENPIQKEDSTSTVSEHSVRLTGAHGPQIYHAPVKLTVPCENSHIRLEEIQQLNKIRHMILNLGSVETSHAVAQKSVLSGESLTTGFCKVGSENTIILTAKTWIGELETSGKVVASVKIRYLGPNKDDLDYPAPVSPRSHTLPSKRFSDIGRTSRSSPNSRTSTPTKSGTRSRQIKAASPSTTSSRSPLKDIFLYANTGPDPQDNPLDAADGHSPDSVEPTFQIDYIKNGAYEITFIPKVAGQYQLSVKMYDRDIPHGSFLLSAVHSKPNTNSRLRSPAKTDRVSMRPQSVRQKGMKRPPSIGPKKNPIEDDLIHRVGGRGRGKGEFSNPQDVSTDHLGRLLIADSTNQCVQVFSVSTKKGRESKYLYRFGERGRGSGQVQRPTGVFGLPNGDIAVSDYDNKVVKIFGEDGTSKYNIGTGKLMGPKGLCVDRNGHLIVVDNKLCQIFVFQLNGKLVTKFGSRGTGPHQLAGPHFVAVNNENQIYISDFYNHCVKIFTPRGNFVNLIGSTGEGCGQFNAPTGLAIDSRGNMIVADWGNSRLQVFDKFGSFLSYINTSEDPLYGPQGLALTLEEQVAVADSGNHCVKIYRYLQ